jgi:hypothetical protein
MALFSARLVRALGGDMKEGEDREVCRPYEKHLKNCSKKQSKTLKKPFRHFVVDSRLRGSEAL